LGVPPPVPVPGATPPPVLPPPMITRGAAPSTAVNLPLRICPRSAILIVPPSFSPLRPTLPTAKPAAGEPSRASLNWFLRTTPRKSTVSGPALTCPVSLLPDWVMVSVKPTLCFFPPALTWKVPS
jgi:hypothetical protein